MAVRRLPMAGGDIPWDGSSAAEARGRSRTSVALSFTAKPWNMRNHCPLPSLSSARSSTEPYAAQEERGAGLPEAAVGKGVVSEHGGVVDDRSAGDEGAEGDTAGGSSAGTKEPAA